MPLDTSIALNVRPIQLDNPLDVQGKAMALRSLATQQQLQQAQMQQAQEAREQDRQLAALYQNNVSPDGSVNRQGLLQGAAQGGLGNRIPGLQKQFTDLDKDQAELGYKRAQTKDLDYGLMKKQTEAVGGTLSSLLAQPQVDHNMVITAISGLVQQGVLPQEKGVEIVRSLPGRPEQLRPFLMQKGLETMDASKRLDLLLPKTEVRNMGGADQVFQTNQLTGQVAAGPTFKKTATVGELMADARGRESNDLKRQEINMGGKPPPGFRWKGDGTLEAIPGGPGDKLPEAQQKQVVGVQNLQNAIGEYRTQLASWGKIDGLNPDARAAMGTKYNNMMLQAKEAYNLGVLNGPDLDILTSVITDPRSAKGAITSRKALDAQASELNRIMSGIGATSGNRRPQDGAAPTNNGASGSWDAPATGMPDDIAAILKKHGGR